MGQPEPPALDLRSPTHPSALAGGAEPADHRTFCLHGAFIGASMLYEQETPSSRTELCILPFPGCRMGTGNGFYFF